MTRRGKAPIVLGAAMWLAALLVWRFAPAIDAALLGAVEAARGGGAARIAEALTGLGEFEVLVPATVAVAIWLVWRGARRPAGWLLAATLSGRLVTAFEKDLFGRARPPLAHRLVEATSPAFPSAHAFNTMLVGLAVAMALRGGRAAVGAAVAFSLAIGATRLVLGVHWPSDVLAGWGSALVWAMLWRPLLRVRTEALTTPGDS